MASNQRRTHGGEWDGGYKNISSGKVLRKYIAKPDLPLEMNKTFNYLLANLSMRKGTYFCVSKGKVEESVWLDNE